MYYTRDVQVGLANNTTMYWKANLWLSIDTYGVDNWSTSEELSIDAMLLHRCIGT